ncbi:MAG: glycogen/starch synthase [Thermodesulfobacteriota bacterium]|nr:glycogen/starch synthase [Thermodesulfobacteriota bacterium]
MKNARKGKKLVVFVGMEGWSKKGGQGDYIRELSQAISKDEHSVVVINPYFDRAHGDISDNRGRYLFTIELPIGQGSLPFGVYYNKIGKVHYLRFKDLYHILFPIVYPDWYKEGTLYSDSLYGYVEAVVLSRIPMHIIKEMGLSPDILHFNDWQTAYGPAYVEIMYRQHDEFKSILNKTGTVLTSHNLAYQGLTKWGLFVNKNDPITELLGSIYPENGLFVGVYDHGSIFEVDAFGITGFPRHYQFEAEGGAECWSDVPGYGGRHNILKFGLETANRIVAVSKGNFRDMLRDDLGFGLGGLIGKRAGQGAVDFVWNGVDVKSASPATLNDLTEEIDKNSGIRFTQFDADDANLLQRRSNNKAAARAKINRLIRNNSDVHYGFLDEMRAEEFLVCGISRLVRQKGYGILFENLEYDSELGIRYGERLIEVLMRLRGNRGNRLQLVIMGTPGDSNGDWVIERLKELTQQYSGQIAVIRKFDSVLANQVRSGSDIFFMPSEYEPGGISNIQAAVMGALCIMTYTGGLIDFVEAGGTHPEFVASGFSYNAPWTLKKTGRDLARAFMVALTMFDKDKAQWLKLVRRAMGLQVDWSYKVPEYLRIYEAAQYMASANN